MIIAIEGKDRSTRLSRKEIKQLREMNIIVEKKYLKDFEMPSSGIKIIEE